MERYQWVWSEQHTIIDEEGVIIKANDKVKAADDPEKMLQELS